MTRIVILGGGPAGYEAALVASQHEADVVLVEEDSLGGTCVAYDCVPSKTFIASAGVRARSTVALMSDDCASARSLTRLLTCGRSTTASSDTSMPISPLRRKPARTPAEAMKVLDGTQS